MAVRSSGLRPTSADVAVLAGVSQSAVSRALSPHRSASPATRRKVEAAAKSLGYRPNALARGMTTKRSNVVALLFAEETALHFPEVLLELNRAFAALGMSVMLFPIASLDCVEGAVDRALSYQIDGIVAAGTLPDTATDALIAADIPLVLYNRADRRVRVSSVSCDHEGCGRLIAHRLVALRHTDIGLIDGPLHSVVAQDRARGLIDTLAEAGLRPSRQTGDFGYTSGIAAANALLAENPELTVIVALSDMMAMGALDHVRFADASRRRDGVSVVGIDGIASGSSLAYRLTTIGQPLAVMAKATAQVLRETIADPQRTAEARAFAGQWAERDTLTSPI